MQCNGKTLSHLPRIIMVFILFVSFLSVIKKRSWMKLVKTFMGKYDMLIFKIRNWQFVTLLPSVTRMLIKTWDLLTVAAGRHSTSSDENCEKKQGQWIKLIRFFTFLESLHRADYTKVFFDIFVVYVQKEKKKKKEKNNTTWILKIVSSASWSDSNHEVW